MPYVTITTVDGQHIALMGRAAAIALWVAMHPDEVARDLGALRFDWGTGAPVKVKVEYAYPAISA